MEENVADLISVARAIELIDALPVAPRQVSVPLHQAIGMRLAEDLAADRDYPPFDKSLMDGYAVRSSDVKLVPVKLNVIGESAAGQTPFATVGPGETMAVMTGAPIPRGADAIVPIEETDSPTFITAGGRVGIRQSVTPGKSIAYFGSDVRKGTTVLSAGALIQAPQIAVAAFCGAQTLAVWDRPRCSVLASGDEIVGPGQSPGPAQIRNSNNPMLLALLSKLGCTPRDMGIVPDRPAEIAQRIAEGLADDFLFITGGMSMGQYDYVPRILAEMGGDLKITKLRIRPGKPFVLAVMPNGKYVFGLPGNPVSAFVCTLRIASRLLARQSGAKPDDRIVSMPLAEPLAPNGPREFYQPAQIERGKLRPLKWKGSADIFTLACADWLLIRPENGAAVSAGENVPAISLA